MDITYLGHSSFKIRGKNATIMTDPFDPEATGLKFPKVEADIVTISHHHPDHFNLNPFSDPKFVKQPVVVDGPGEYEIKGVNILGIPCFHDDKEGAERGKNNVYEIRIDGLVLLHLGDLGHRLTEKQSEDIENVDVLFLPIGGKYTINSQVASEIVSELQPKIVIPMHYQASGLNEKNFAGLTGVEEFLKVMGKSDVVPQDKLVVSKDKLAEEMQVVVLKS